MVHRNLIGEKIKYFIERTPHLTQTKLADKLGVSQSKVSEWINGKKEPRITELQSLADIFNISVYELIPNNSYKKEKNNFGENYIAIDQQTIHNHQDIEDIKKLHWESIETLKEFNQILKQENSELKKEIIEFKNSLKSN